MTGIEGPAAGWLLNKLGPAARWIGRRVASDHLPIRSWRAWPDQHYPAFYLFAAVAPSHTPKSIDTVDFIDRACDLVRDQFETVFPNEPEHASTELVRFREPVAGVLGADNIIGIHPCGLIELQLVLTALPNTKVPIRSLVRAVQRLHEALNTAYAEGLCKHEHLHRRRVDWRIGVNGFAIDLDNHGHAHWTEVVADNLPSRRTTNPVPHCPRSGYAHVELTSLRRDAAVRAILGPTLTAMLSSSGYLGAAEIESCVEATLDASLELSTG